MATDKQLNLAQWKMEVKGMDFVTVYGKKQHVGDTYKRFTQHIKEFTTMLFSNDKLSLVSFRQTGFVNLQRKELPKNWWDIATQVGEGKNVENNPLKGMATKQDVYDAFLPAYRAIKENFDKRFKLFSWIFDHAKYTAERDSLKALSGLMQSVTGDSPAELENRYAEYKSRVQLKENADKVIKKEVDEKRKAVKQLNSKLKNMPKETDEEQADEFMDNDMANDYVQESGRSQFTVDLNEDKSIEIQPKIQDNGSLERTVDNSLSSDL